MSKLAHFCVLSAFAVSGCFHTGDGPEPRKAEGKLELLSLTDPRGQIENYRTFGNVARTDKRMAGEDALDNEIVIRCTVRTPPKNIDAPRAGALALVLPIVASWVIDYAISTASSWAKQRLAEYSGLTAAALRFGPPATQYFYESAPPPRLSVGCLRLRRVIEPTAAGGPSTLAAEAIVLVELTPAADALMITPLRLYFDTPLARTSGDRNAKFGVSVGATFDALWQAESTGEGKSARIWSETVLTQKIVGINDQGSERQRLHYYNLGPGRAIVPNAKPLPNPPIVVPLVPWSRQDKTGSSPGAQSLGAGKLTLTLAEVGDPPLVLEIVAGTLNDHGKDIGDFLKDAARKAIAPDEASSQ